MIYHLHGRMHSHDHAQVIACIEETASYLPLLLQVYLDRVYDFNNMFDWAAVVWDDWDLAPGFRGANAARKSSSHLARCAMSSFVYQDEVVEMCKL